MAEFQGNQVEGVMDIDCDMERQEDTSRKDVMDMKGAVDSSDCSQSPTIGLLKQAMIDTVSKSDAHFKHQQRGEPDLSIEEKAEIASDLLEKSPTIFLERFGKYLAEEHLGYFSIYPGDYTIEFYLKEIRKQLDAKKCRVLVRNRRYAAMKVLVEKGEYFSEEEMKSRDPLLYEQMIGQFLSEEEIIAQVDKCEASLANILMNHIQVQKNNELYKMQKEVEKSQVQEMELVETFEQSTPISGDQDEEEEEDDDEEESELESEDEEKVKWEPSKEEKNDMRQEFLRTMQHRFLAGEDKDFDYGKVDGNEEYDALDIRNQDEEEKYFDEEDPESIHSQTSDT